MSNPDVMMYVPFALNGKKNTIQITRQTNQDAEDATLSEGFPDVTMIKESVGGKAPKGLDFNGIFYLLSADTVHRQSGKQIQYDATYATTYGGYSKGSILQSTDLTKSYINTVDGNTTDPDSSSASGWNVYAKTPTATSTTVGTVKIADTLTSNATDTALTANQGRILASMIQGADDHLWIGSTLIQWGAVDYDTNPGEIQYNLTFPYPFPNKCLHFGANRKMVQHSPKGDGGVNIVGDPTNTNIVLSIQTYNDTNSSDLRGFVWFAIGN